MSNVASWTQCQVRSLGLTGSQRNRHIRQYGQYVISACIGKNANASRAYSIVTEKSFWPLIEEAINEVKFTFKNVTVDNIKVKDFSTFSGRAKKKGFLAFSTEKDILSKSSVTYVPQSDHIEIVILNLSPDKRRLYWVAKVYKVIADNLKIYYTLISAIAFTESSELKNTWWPCPTVNTLHNRTPSFSFNTIWTLKARDPGEIIDSRCSLAWRLWRSHRYFPMR